MHTHAQLSASPKPKTPLHAPPNLSAILRGTGIHPRLRVGAVDDPAEAEADRIADQVMSMPVPKAGDVVHCKCAACEDDELHCKEISGGSREGGTLSPTAESLVNNLGPGVPLPASERSFFEPRFGRSLEHVRVHHGPRANEAAESIGARAFAMANRIAFANGEFGTGDAARPLLAHELAHTLPRQNTTVLLRRSPKTNWPEFDLTETAAEKLSDAELEQATHAVQAYLIQRRASSEFTVQAQRNLTILERQVTKRSNSKTPNQTNLTSVRTFDTVPNQITNTVPRPGSLSLSGGYQLIPAEGKMSKAEIDSIPDGSIKIVEMISTASRAGMNAGANSYLTAFGFASAGENSIGIVGMPSFQWGSFYTTQSTTYLGHTAVTVRVGGKLVSVQGFTPKLFELLKKYGATVSGKDGVEGSIANDSWLFTKTNSQSVEWAVSKEAANKFLQELDVVGEVPKVKWTGVPNGCQGVNCVLYAVERVEGNLGGRFSQVTPKGTTPIVDMASKGQTLKNNASQGKFIEALKSAESGASEIAPMDGALGQAVVGGFKNVPKYVKVLKYGGRAFFVIGMAASVIEVVTAKDGEKTRTAIGAGAGFLGGLAMGATAGLVCGPGAPVCSVVLGLGFGLFGSLTARTLAEEVYDVSTGRKKVSDKLPIFPRKETYPDGSFLDQRGNWFPGYGPKQ
jgi:Domain of unknown function (DUF4157)